MPKYNHVFNIGDFNVHICCPDKPMVKGLFKPNWPLILYSWCLD